MEAEDLMAGSNYCQRQRDTRTLKARSTAASAWAGCFVTITVKPRENEHARFFGHYEDGRLSFKSICGAESSF